MPQLVKAVSVFIFRIGVIGEIFGLFLNGRATNYLYLHRRKL